VTAYLLLNAQEVGQILCGKVVLPVAVRHHEQEQVPSQGHHLVEDGEFVICQRALMIISVCLLKR